jgi:hypothetical protein
MTTINLYQEQNDTSAANKQDRTANKGLYGSLAVLVITLLVFGGVKFYAIDLQKKGVAADQQIEDIKKNFSGEKVNLAVDFQQRIDAIDKNMASKDDIDGILLKVAETVSSDVRMVSYSQEGDSLVVVLASDNFFSVARQTLRFKENKNFSGVSVSKIQRKEKLIEFSINATYAPVAVASQSNSTEANK